MPSFQKLLQGLFGAGEGQSYRRRVPQPAGYRFQPTIDELESRWLPSVTLGSAGNFAVLGLADTHIYNDHALVTGNEGVSQHGKLRNSNHSTITGNVYEYAKGEYKGHGKLDGTLNIDPTLMTQADQDAASAAAEAAALAPTQTLKSITHATTITGNGGLNVIQINGNIKASLTLSGTASDIFIVNVKGSVDLGHKESLSLAGGVTASHVLYNFTGAHGSITADFGSTINGTLLAPKYSVDLAATVNGEIIGGGCSINLECGAKVTQINFLAPASISGRVINETNNSGLTGMTIQLTGTDYLGNSVSMQTLSAADGSYHFNNLLPGTYKLTEIFPAGVVDDHNTVGTAGGTISGNQISGITLNAGFDATGYTFGDLLSGSGGGGGGGS